MSKKVLAAVDLQALTPWAVAYGIQLAARLRFPLVLLAVCPQLTAIGVHQAPALSPDLPEEHRRWLNQVMAECQRETVPLELFLAPGPFIQELKRFALTQPGIQFLVVGAPRGLSPKAGAGLASDLRRLSQFFPGDILVVQEQGQVASLSGLPDVSKSQGRDA